MIRRRGRPACGCALIAVSDVERVLSDLGLAPQYNGLMSVRRTRAMGMAQQLGLRVREDEFGRPALARADAVRVVEAVRERKRASHAQLEADIRAAQQRRDQFEADIRQQAEDRRAATQVPATPVRLPEGVRLTTFGASMFDPRPGGSR